MHQYDADSGEQRDIQWRISMEEDLDALLDAKLEQEVLDLDPTLLDTNKNKEVGHQNLLQQNMLVKMNAKNNVKNDRQKAPVQSTPSPYKSNKNKKAPAQQSAPAEQSSLWNFWS